MIGIYGFSVLRLDGTEEALARFKGNVMLIVNTASRCGFTPQYAGLERLQRAYASRGFSVLGFPCNQFGNQEPDDAADIGRFCQLTYDVSFPMFAKIEVNGKEAHPLYTFLKAARPGLLGSRSIKWNFTKFLVSRTGKVIERFAPMTKPETINGKIERLL